MPTSIRLKPEVEDRLNRLVERTGRSKTYYLSQLIEQGLDQLEWENLVLQDATDIRAGRQATYSDAEARRILGLDA
ncbi:MAG: hypothetical protein LBL92_00645 [Propionibacteriaceae bacterium]|jgi:RHH-type rel operon transcriptional repressor/antitoxin RelB|nr:hypothetical protein [Propionibacteriaceae bacterium]